MLTAIVLGWVLASGEGATMHRSPHTEDSFWITGVKLTQISSGLGNEELETGFGGAVFAETTLIEGWLEAELSVGFLALSDETLVPIELVAKKPFHVGILGPYVGIGPTVDIVRRDDTELFAGVSTTIGTYIWVTTHVAIDIDVVYSAVFENDSILNELLANVGVAVRF